MTDNLLSQDQETEPKSYIEALTAPGAKFDKTKYASEAEMYEAIARGKYEADKFIDIKNKTFDDLSNDYLKLREEYNAKASLQELIDQMSTSTTNTSTENTQNKDEVKQPSFDPAQLESLIDTRYKANKKQELEQANFNSAKSKLIERYGPNYSTHINSQLDDLGMTPEEFNQMARTNPKLFERTFISSSKSEDLTSLPHSSLNTAGFTPRGAEKRSWSYYQKMKKENPKLYSQPKTQLQLMKDLEALGEDFKDGDFHAYN